jgi:hypothetical protein
MINQLSGQSERTMLHVGVRNSGSVEAVSAPPAKPVTATALAPKSVANDNVEISTEARQLSRTQSDQNPVATARGLDAQKNEDTQRATASFIEVVKYFPPYLGDTKRMELLENYPQLLKEIKKMMMPPPLDLVTSSVKNPDTTLGDTGNTSSTAP